MQQLADEIIARGWVTVTYRDILMDLREGKCPNENTVLVSIDDLGTNWLRPDFVTMIRMFTDRGLKVVVGVVVKEPQASFIWDYMIQLEETGSEVASHTVNHYQLSALSDAALEEEISGSYAIICEHLGRCPVTLILPFGDGLDDLRVVVFSDDYAYVVSITGGRTFTGELPFVLGRIPPNNDDQVITANLLDQFYEFNLQALNPE
jgi:hypothetical protein